MYSPSETFPSITGAVLAFGTLMDVKGSFAETLVGTKMDRRKAKVTIMTNSLFIQYHPFVLNLVLTYRNSIALFLCLIAVEYKKYVNICTLFVILKSTIY